MAEGPDLSHPVFVHFYRAVVAHMDVWRQRMDATTNWAAATTAAMVTFSFGSVDSPHFVLLLGLGFTGVFLLMESRRYQTFDLWRRRFRLLNRHLVVPVLTGTTGAAATEQRDAMMQLAEDLGRSSPHLRLLPALGFRLRRNYAYLLGVELAAWLLKLAMHPTAAESWGGLVGRAAIGPIAGSVVVTSLGLLILALAVVALRAPSERMLNWTDTPSPYERWVAGARSRRPET